MKTSNEISLVKVPEVTLGFWLIKTAATTLGETGGDAVSMSMNLGYLVSTAIFMALFVGAVKLQVQARQFHAFLYWATIIASTTVGTTLADYATRSLGIGYAGGSILLLALLLASLFSWHKALGRIDVASIHTPKAEFYYWLTIMFSQTLGTALGGWRIVRTVVLCAVCAAWPRAVKTHTARQTASSEEKWPAKRINTALFTEIPVRRALQRIR